MMVVNAGTVRVAAVIVVFVLLYGSRLSKGVSRQTPAGLVFAMKPMVIVARIGAVLLYAGFLAYTVKTSPQTTPIWFYGVFLLAVGFILMQLPATITLEAEALTQTYWFLKKRVIRYGEVMTIQAFQAGRAIRVMGDNRTIITHTNNHSASEEFRVEMERRTGKRAS